MPHTIWLPAIISLISVFLGATITHWSNDRIQTKVMLDKLNIDKKAEALRIVLDTNRLITKHQICIISLLKGRITHEEFLIKEQNLQYEITDILRELIPFKPFLEKEIINDLKVYHEHFSLRICMKVYDIYRDPEDTNVNYYKEDEHPYFKEDYMYVQLGYVKICEDLSEELKLDYDKLSNIKMKDKFKLNLFK